MKHLTPYKIFESGSTEHFCVVIDWEHGDANTDELRRYPFKSEEDMDDFLNFIYDLRKFIPDSGYGNTGHFADDHYTREGKWIDEVSKKYGGKFSELVPNDRKFGRNRRYSPAVNSIWVEIDKQPLNIVWNKSLKLNIIDLPSIGDDIDTNIGNISFYGPTLWRKDDRYLSYNDLEYLDDDLKCKECGGSGWDEHSSNRTSNYERCPACKGKAREYSKISATVTDCKIQFYEPYKRDKWVSVNGREKLVDSYLTYRDYCYFNYVLLCDVGLGLITVSPNPSTGFDPKFDMKYHYAKYGSNDFYLVN